VFIVLNSTERTKRQYLNNRY